MLLSSLCDSGLEPQQLVCLNRLLLSDTDLRRRYLLYMGVHATLHYLFGGEPREPGQAQSRMFVPNPVPRKTWKRHGGCERRSRTRRLLSSAWQPPAGFSSWPSSAPLTGGGPAVLAAGFSKPAPIVARISRDTGLRFDGIGLSAGVNDPLRAGTYRLAEGIVQLTFTRGAEVMITAPAEFTLQSEERLYLKRGSSPRRCRSEPRGSPSRHRVRPSWTWGPSSRRT